MNAALAIRRYTPLLAFLLLPNVYVHPAFGKLLFCAADVLAALLLFVIVACKLPATARPAPPPRDPTTARAGGTASSSSALPAAAAALWLLNPYTATISTRGNGDSLVVLMQLGVLALLQPTRPVAVAQLSAPRVAAAGALYGLLVHWRIFPVLYGPCLIALFWAAARAQRARSALASWLAACLAFGLPAAAVFFGLGAAFYAMYGHAFLHEAFLYHAGRHDPRHNFAPHFLYTYLDKFSDFPGDSRPVPLWLDPAACALPCMAAAVLAIAWRFRARLDAAMLLTTMAFVAFNKVSTAQYFVWYLGLLPALLPELVRGWSAAQTGAAVAWVVTQLLWLASAYQLEFQVRALSHRSCAPRGA